MKVKNSILKKTIIGILASVMAISITPQVSLQNNVSTVEAAQVKLNNKKITLRKGKTKRLKLKNASGKIKWKSNKQSVATVSKKGLVKAKKTGKATITATYRNKKYKCVVTVINKSSESGSSSGKGNSGSSNGNSSSKNQTSTVYWTPGGSVYHTSRNCSTLSRSRTVYSGSRSESGKSRACKVCS